MDIELLIKATRKQSNTFIVKDRLELLKIIELNKGNIDLIKEKLNNDIDSVLTSYKYVIDKEPGNKELKKELQELQKLTTFKQN